MKTLQISIIVILILPDLLYSQDDKLAASLKGIPSHYTGNINERTVYSKETNSTFIIKIYLPITYQDSLQKKYPLLVLTDAWWTMGIAQTTFDYMTMTKEIPEVIIIGICYPDTNTLGMFRARMRDMSPTHADGYEPSGAAEEFISFIEKELLPDIESRYRINASDKCYYGHSLGGLLGSHILLEHPGIFNRYIIGSPSYWWNNKEIVNRFSSKTSFPSDSIKSIYTFMGGKEGKLMITGFNDFNDLLKTKLTTIKNFHSQLFDDETHTSVSSAAFSTAIKFIYKDR